MLFMTSPSHHFSWHPFILLWQEVMKCLMSYGPHSLGLILTGLGCSSAVKGGNRRRTEELLIDCPVTRLITVDTDIRPFSVLCRHSVIYSINERLIKKIPVKLEFAIIALTLLLHRSFQRQACRYTKVLIPSRHQGQYLEVRKGCGMKRNITSMSWLCLVFNQRIKAQPAVWKDLICTQYWMEQELSTPLCTQLLSPALITYNIAHYCQAILWPVYEMRLLRVHRLFI